MKTMNRAPVLPDASLIAHSVSSGNSPQVKSVILLKGRLRDPIGGQKHKNNFQAIIH